LVDRLRGSLRVYVLRLGAVLLHVVAAIAAFRLLVSPRLNFARCARSLPFRFGCTRSPDRVVAVDFVVRVCLPLRDRSLRTALRCVAVYVLVRSFTAFVVTLIFCALTVLLCHVTVAYHTVLPIVGRVPA